MPEPISPIDHSHPQRVRFTRKSKKSSGEGHGEGGDDCKEAEAEEAGGEWRGGGDADARLGW